MSEFEGLLEEYGKEGMKDVGLGEARGCDLLARRNVMALDERLKLEGGKLEKVVEKVRGLEGVIVEMQTKLAELIKENAVLKANAMETKTMAVFEGGEDMPMLPEMFR